MRSADYDAWHLPVLVDAVIDNLSIKPGGLYVDLTAGGGGHSRAILEKLGQNGRLLVADRDPEALEVSSERLKDVETSAIFDVIEARFSDFPSWLDTGDIGNIDGLLADLGVSSHQLDTAERGFSYLHDGPLDMRMSPAQGKTAADLIADLRESDLVALLRLYGEEQYAYSIAKSIVKRRAERPITTTGELVDIVSHAVPSHVRREGNPARLTFQALRMAVNHEQEELSHLLQVLPDAMAPGGRVAIISFHSLEDRMVKQAMKRWESPCDCPRDFPVCVCGKRSLGQCITGKPIVADVAECKGNRRARSAKLRVFEFAEVEV